jgi:type II secretory pathway pseudopilin PulG
VRFAREELGETLVETLLTVALLGILATGIVGAMASVIRASDFDAKQAGSEVVLRSYAEARTHAPYLPCTAGQSTNPYGSSSPSGFVAPANYTATVSTVTFWNGTSSSPLTFLPTCPATGDAGLQSLTLQVVPPSGPTQTLTVETRSP